MTDAVIKVEDKDEVTKNIKIEFSTEVVTKRYEEELAKATKYVHLKGFRQGKAPRHLVEKFYGDSVRDDVVSKLIDDAFKETVREHKLNIVGMPKINVGKDEQGVNYVTNIEVSLFPDPDIKNYFQESFSVELDEYKEEDVEQEIEHLRESFAEDEDVTDRTKVKEGDVVFGGYQGYVDGEADETMVMKDATVHLEKQRTRPEFIAALVGANVGDEVDVVVKFTEDAPRDELKNKDVTFKFKVEKIKKRVFPEVNDEFAAKTRRAKTAGELRESIAKRIKRQCARTNRERKEEKLFNELIKNNPFLVPEALVDEQIKKLLVSHGFADEKTVYSRDYDLTAHRLALSSYAETQVRRAIITEKILKKENVQISDEELNTWLDNQATELGETRALVDRSYRYPEQKEDLRRYVNYMMMVDRLLDKAQITEVKQEKA